LSDIEWATQLVQWSRAAGRPKMQSPNTLEALIALRDAGTIRQDDWEIMNDAYIALLKQRLRRFLTEGRANDTPSSQSEDVLGTRAKVRELFERLFNGG